MNDKSPYTNRLISEKSPYLLQHAHNPVDWFPWGDEAFRVAKEQDKPIFLSIGYASCHWCHVMEKESFDDPDIAKLLNDAFINVKVDREELPYIDSLYMEFAQSMMSGAAGWPLTVILTPDLQPFFAATYLPPHTKQGMMGLDDLTKRIKDVWRGEDRERVLAQAEKIVEIFTESVHVRGTDLPIKEVVEDTAEMLFKMSDSVWGGIKGAPKFPIGYQYNMLLNYFAKMKDSRAVFMVEKTLEMMQRGGIHDHLGGGFARYSTDDKWLIPHFEKMLYDNALLMDAYIAAWQLTKKPLYREVAEEIATYILRDMTHPEGGFYSSEDADSEGHEGRFYTWSREEIETAVGPADAKLICDFYAIQDIGAFQGRNILHTPLSLQEYALKLQLDPIFLREKLRALRELLWKKREERVHPHKDDKILSSWNGLVIHSLSQAGAAFGKKEYIDAAVKAAGFIRKNMWKDGKLLRRWREGEAGFTGGLEDYAYLIRGLLTLFEVGRGSEWLAWAIEMSDILDKEFKAEEGAYYQTEAYEPNVILRKTQFSDGAEPSGNALQCENLIRLERITGDEKYLALQEDILRAVNQFLDSYAPGYCFHVMNVGNYYDSNAPVLVAALNAAEDSKEEILKEIYSDFIVHKSIIWWKEGDDKLLEIIPSLSERRVVEGKTTLYICHGRVCMSPLTDLEEIKKALVRE